MQYLQNSAFTVPARSGVDYDFRWDLCFLSDEQFLARHGETKTETRTALQWKQAQ